MYVTIRHVLLFENKKKMVYDRDSTEKLVCFFGYCKVQRCLHCKGILPDWSPPSIKFWVICTVLIFQSPQYIVWYVLSFHYFYVFPSTVISGCWCACSWWRYIVPRAKSEGRSCKRYSVKASYKCIPHI